MSDEEEKHRWSWEVFMACMFVGLGLGMIFGESGAGVIIGMGVGFLLSAFVRIKRIERGFTVRIPRGLGGVALMLVGIALILLGFQVLGVMPMELARYAGGLALIGLGILFLVGAGMILRRS